MRWMTLGPIIQSEVSQKEKDKYHILMHIYRMQKNGIEEFIYMTAGDKQTKNRLSDMRRGEAEMYGESNIETHITIWKIRQPVETHCMTKGA